MPLEEKHPYNKLYEECLGKAREIFIERNAQYNNEVDIREYWTFGIRSIIHEISKKVLRMKSTVFGLHYEKARESMKDSILDVINYCCFLYAELSLKEKDFQKQSRTYGKYKVDKKKT